MMMMKMKKMTMTIKTIINKKILIAIKDLRTPSTI